MAAVVGHNTVAAVVPRNRPAEIVKVAMNTVPPPARKATSGVSVHGEWDIGAKD